MIPVAIFGFLFGSVLAWRFRVWILLPLTILTIAAVVIYGLSVGAGVLTIVKLSLVLGAMPQLGFAFGLLARHVLGAIRSPRSADEPKVQPPFDQRSLTDTIVPRP